MSDNETFLRTPTQARGQITEEERVKIEAIAKKWMAIGLRTEPIESNLIIPAIKGLYKVANLSEPSVYTVSSPIVAIASGALAVGISHIRKLDKEGEVTDAIMSQSIRNAVGVVEKVMQLKEEIVENIYMIIDRVTERKTPRQAPKRKLDEQQRADVAEVSNFLMKCLQRWWHMYQGGNLWPGVSSYLESMRDVIGLTGLPGWDAYSWWERSAIHGGFRIVHKDFCLVSDFPKGIFVDDQARQHNETGPSHEWRDGWKLYYHHGIMVDRKIIEEPGSITVDEIRKQENQEIRRIMITKMGWGKFVEQAKVKTIHQDFLETNFPSIPVSELVAPGHRLVTGYRKGREEAELIMCEELTDFENRPLVFIRLTDPSTGRQYTLRTSHDMRRCYQAVGRSFNGMTEEQYKSGKYLRQGDVMLLPLSENPRLVQQHS